MTRFEPACAGFVVVLFVAASSAQQQAGQATGAAGRLQLVAAFEHQVTGGRSRRTGASS